MQGEPIQMQNFADTKVVCDELIHWYWHFAVTRPEQDQMRLRWIQDIYSFH